VIQILHGDYDYYYDLAERHQDVIDAFIVGGRTLERKLTARLPERARDVYRLPYGIPVAAGSTPRPPRVRPNCASCLSAACTATRASSTFR